MPNINRIDHICIAVKDRKTKAWLGCHPALSSTLEGGVQINRHGAVLPTVNGPEVGHRIYFEDHDEAQHIITSKLREIRRPQPDELDHYKVA